MKRKRGVALFVMLSFLLGLGACKTSEVKEAEVTEAKENVLEAEVETTEVEEQGSYVEDHSSGAVEVLTEESAETGQIISITMAEMEEKLAEGETFMVSFVTIDCPYCQDFHSMLVDYIQEHIVTMYQVILDYEEKPEEENRKIIKEYFSEFNTVPGVFYVINGENGSYHDTYNLGVGMEEFDRWVQENNIEAK